MQENIEDRLLISVACGIGMATEELANIKAQIFALAEERGILVYEDDGEVDSVPVRIAPPRRRIQFPWATVAIVVLLFTPAINLSQIWSTPANAERNWLNNGPMTHNRIVKTFDGKYYEVEVRRALPGYPFAEWISQREISEDQVEAELARMQEQAAN